jgi:pyruvate dehydrogenase E1 component
MYRVRTARDGSPRVRLLGSGTILREALAAAELLESGWEAPAEVWSVTSFTELRRDGLTAERHNRLHPNRPARCSWVEECLGQAPAAAPVIAATDYVRAVPDLIRTWVPAKYVALGTDGYGLSDTRAALRRKFEVDAVSIGYAALHAAGAGRDTLARFRSRYGFEAPDRGPWE